MATDLALSPDVTLLPLLPLRDVVVFPHMVIPLFVGRPKSIKALDVAMDSGKHILLVAQKSAAKDDPGAEDLYPIGCVATVLQMLKLPDGTVKVLVEGAHRSSVVRVMACKDTATLRRSIFLLSWYNLFIYLPLVVICVCVPQPR